MPKDPRFVGSDAESVFKQVSQIVRSSEARSLWERLRDEMRKKKTPASAAEYLRSSFTEISKRLEKEIERVSGQI